MNEDQKVQSFFEQMKAQDAKRSLPKFEKPRQHKFPIRMVLAIAASLVLLAWWQGVFEKEEELYKDTIVITFSVDEDNTPELGIKATSSMNVWEASTDFLLTSN